MPKVVVFGSLNMDLSIFCDYIPRAGETMSGKDFITNPGGKGANQAVAASKLGANVEMIGAVGDDEFGKVLVRNLEEVGVNCKEVKKIDNISSGIAVIIRTEDNNRIILDPGANHSLKTEQADEAIKKIANSGDFFLTQLECDIETTFRAMECAHDLGLKCVINPAPARPIPAKEWANIDCIVVNESECEIITGIYPESKKTASKAGKYLSELGVNEIVITLGDKGAYGRQGDQDFFVPAYPTAAIDTTAAGDTFIGAMLAAQAEGLSFKESLEFAGLASAITVSREGAQQSIPNREEIEIYKESLK